VTPETPYTEERDRIVYYLDNSAATWQPVTSDQLSVTSDQLSVTSDQLSVTSYRYLPER
jgi:hypothetical protein